jgi:long-chain acyl-CoA synthetase
MAVNGLVAADVVFGGETTRAALLERRAAQAAQGLAALGVGEGDVIALVLRNDVPYLELMQACRLVGCYFCQVNWHLTASEVGFILRDSGARALFVHEDLLPGIEEAVPAHIRVVAVRPHACVSQAYRSAPGGARLREATDYAQWVEQHAPFDGAPRGTLGAMGYTSGTTGRPKGVRRLPAPAPAFADDRAAQGQRLQAMVEQAYGLRPGCRAYMCAPLYHGAPCLYAREALRMGELLVLEPKFDPERVLAAIERYGIDVLYLVPAMFARLLALPLATRRRYDPSPVRFVACTGSPCPPALKAAMLDWWGLVIHETYAATELGLVTLATPELARRKPGSAGRPIGDATVRVFSAGGRPCAPGEVGLIHACQPAYGDFTYHGNPAARAAIEREGLVTLGDVGYLDEEGDLFVCDRASDMVISGGVNIYPAEIEAVLAQLPEVSDCAVFGIPDPEYGEALLAQVELVPGRAIDAAEVLAHLRHRLAGFKVPRRIEFIAALPRDENGKVAKRKLREPYWAGQARRI